MQFDSFTFLIFLFLVLCLHHLPITWQLKKLNLLLASYLFYAAWNPPFILLLWISTAIDWRVSLQLSHTTAKTSRQLLLATSLFTNLGLLALFKYSDFLLHNFSAALQFVNIAYHPAKLGLILPLGISFYTFQTLSYTIDVFKRKTKPCPSLLDYCLYVSFFPQLVAGPIVRSTDFLPQCQKPRTASRHEISWGFALLILGLFEKSVLADSTLAPIVEHVFDVTREPNALEAWTGVLAFSGQIFCDFAGYSTCAIGIAMMLGFSLPRNFNFPYAATGFADFWKRWHISLSTWLKDYLYIPLGGNRQGSIRTAINIIITMLLGGLWHGASWSFVFWGGLHSLYLIAERISMPMIQKYALAKYRIMQLFAAASTFLFVSFAWCFFRAKTFDRALGAAASMLGHYPKNQPALLNSLEITTALIVVSVIVVIHWLMRYRTLKEMATQWPWWSTALILALMMIALVMSPGVEDRAFIYFQF